jgi:hypothetical protein
MKKLRFAILKNEIEDDHALWLKVCEERKNLVEWEVIDLPSADWLEQTTATHFDGLLAAPPGWNNVFKAMYDERATILSAVCGIPIYPSLGEILIYENKKYLSYWLAANQIPHPKTWVFYNRQDADDFVNNAPLPLVGKANIGASGRGVRILKTRGDAVGYIRRTFSGKGPSRSIGPNLKKKGLLKRALKKLMNPAVFRAKLNQYQHQRSDVQKDFVVLQEYVPHEFEWRAVRIGESFFAHKKMKTGDKASGTLVKGYDNPPLALFDFVKKITDKHGFRSQAVDLFETADRRYLVNEMQCIFGQSGPYQMLVNGVPGRYILQNGQWQFEPGDFNRHESFLLRLDDFLNILIKHPAASQV